MNLNRIGNNGFGIGFKADMNQNFDILEGNSQGIQSQLREVSLKAVTASTDNLVYGSDGSKSIEDILSHTDEYFQILTHSNASIYNNQFNVASNGYFFYRVKTINKIAPGKAISVAVDMLTDNANVLKGYRFINSSGETIQQVSSLEDYGNGLFMKENMIVPNGASFFEIRIDARPIASSGVTFINPRIIAGSFVGNVNYALNKDVEKKYGPEDINFFPDPLLIKGDWINYVEPGTTYDFITEGNERRLLFKSRTDIPNGVAAIGYDFPILDKNMKNGDKIGVDVNVVEYSNSIDVRFYVTIMFYNIDKKEWDSSNRKRVAINKLGRAVIKDIVIPNGTVYIRLRLDGAAGQTIMPQAHFKLNEINITKSSDNVRKTKTAVDSVVVSSMITESMTRMMNDKTLYVSWNGNDMASGETSKSPLRSIQKAIDLGANIICVERGEYYNVSLNATDFKSITIIPWDHATFTQDKPNGEMISLYGGEKISPNSWVPFNSIYAHLYAGNTYYTKVFIDKTLPIDTGGTRPSYNALLWEDNQKLIPKLTISEVEATPGSFTYDGTNIYVNPYNVGLPIGNKVYIAATKSSVLDVSKTKKVNLQDVEAKYCLATPIVARNVKDLRAHNCSANNSGQSDGWSLDNSNGILINCKSSWNRNDGFNIHGYGDTVFINCTGHDNEDDGISHHDGCTGTIIGGSWYNNGKGGISPTYGAFIEMYGDIVSYNNNYGLYILGTKGVTKRRTVNISDIKCYGNKVSGVLISHEYDILMRNVNLKNNPIGVQVNSNGSLIIEESTINDNTAVGVSNTGGESTVTIKDCTISDNARGVQNTGSGKTILSRNKILYNSISGIQLTTGTVSVERRNNLYGNATDYEGAIPQSEKDKNVSVPAV